MLCATWGEVGVFSHNRSYFECSNLFFFFTPTIAERWTNGWRAMLRNVCKNSQPPSACWGVSILTRLVNFNLASLNFVWDFFHVLLAFHLDFCHQLEMEFHLPFVLVKVTGKKWREFRCWLLFEKGTTSTCFSEKNAEDGFSKDHLKTQSRIRKQLYGYGIGISLQNS